MRNKSWEVKILILGYKENSRAVSWRRLDMMVRLFSDNQS